MSILRVSSLSFLFFFNDTATTEIYTLSLHDALPISFNRGKRKVGDVSADIKMLFHERTLAQLVFIKERSEEHTSELQSQSNLVCRLLLEKKKKRSTTCLASNICRYRHSYAVSLHETR